jgi:hypothetical protein
MNFERVILSAVAAGAFLVVPVFAQTPPSPPAGTQTSATPQAQNGAAQSKIGAGVVIPAQLSKSVDAKKAKPGDKIEAKTTMDLLSHGQVVIPRDTKVIGHVTAAKPHSKESPDSSVGLAFDRISMKDGSEVPVKAAVQAIGRPLSAFASPMGESAGMPPAGAPSSGASDSRGTMAGSQRSNSGSPSSSYPSNAPSQMPSGAAGSEAPAGAVLDPHSQGVVGMKGIQLNSSGEGSVVSSADNNVHLDSGTQLVLRTE